MMCGYKRRDAFTLIELLLVLVIIGLITALAIRQFSQYWQTSQITLVKSDVTELTQALNRYYHLQGCQSDSSFRGDFNPTMKEMGLPDKFASAPPIVTSFAAQIVDTQQTTKLSKQKIYQLRIVANLNSRYKQGQVQWYAGLLGAEVSGANKITWTLLPYQRRTEPDNALWISQAHGASFRQEQNKAGESQGLQSDSYCAH